MRSCGVNSIRSVNDSPTLRPSTSIGASRQRHSSPWGSIERTIGVRRATWAGSTSTAQTAARSCGTTADDRFVAEKRVTG